MCHTIGGNVPNILILTSLDKFCPQLLGSYGCICMKVLSSHVESAVGNFFHLMRYSIIAWFHSCLVLVSIIFSSSNMFFPSLKLLWLWCWSMLFHLVFLHLQYFEIGCQFSMWYTIDWNIYFHYSNLDRNIVLWMNWNGGLMYPLFDAT